MLTRGYIVIPREKIAAVADDLDLMGLLVALVSDACFRPGVAPGGAALQAGQLATGKRSLAARFRRTESWCHRALKRLQDRTVIEIRANRQGTIVTICDWGTYSPSPEQSEPRSNRKQNASELRSNRSRTKSEPLLNQKSQIPIPPPTPQGEQGEWGVLIAELRGLGLGVAERVVADVRSNGCAAAEVAAIIDHFRRGLDPQPPAWGPGALANQIESHRPGGDPASGWPAPSAGHAEAIARAKASHAAAAQDDSGQFDKWWRGDCTTAAYSRLGQMSPAARGALYAATSGRSADEYCEDVDPLLIDALRLEITREQRPRFAARAELAAARTRYVEVVA